MNPRLTPREKDVLKLVQRRMCNKEIAWELNCSKYTARFHVSQLLHKFGVQSRLDLILMQYKRRETC